MSGKKSLWKTPNIYSYYIYFIKYAMLNAKLFLKCFFLLFILISLSIYLGFYVAFNTVQVISQRVVGRAEETSTYSSLGFCAINCRPTASNYQLSHLYIDIIQQTEKSFEVCQSAKLLFFFVVAQTSR